MQVKQSEEFWNKSYFQTSKHFEKNIKNISGIFVAFNTNLDAIKYVDSTLLNFLDIGKFAAKDDCREIHKLDDFKTGLLSSMESGKAMEWQIKDSKTYNYLLDNIKFNTHRIGGQAGIVSNVLAHIGMKNIVVFNPGCSEAEADMYDSRISSPKFSGNSLRLIPANDAYSVHDTPKINFIFEFDKGLKIRSGNKTFTVPRKNRFIVSSRPKGRDPFFPEQILHAHNFSSFFKNIKRVFLSGYQYLSTDKQFFMAKIQLAFIRKTNPDMKIHYEFTSEENLKNVARIIKYILPEVDSLGCNERETCILLDAAGKKNLADTIRDSAYSAAELFEGVRFLKNMAGLKRMHVHNIDYMLCLADKGYADYQKTRKALLLCVESAFAKSINGFIHHAVDLEMSNKVEVNPKGIRQIANMDNYQLAKIDEGVYSCRNNYLVMIPTKIGKHAKATVGLGDTVSSTAFVGDMV